MENSTLPQLEITQASHLNVFHENHRFILESVLILLSVGANAFGLIVVVMTQSNSKQKSVYHILYIYVSATNIAACLVTWLCGNLSFLFRDWFQRNITSNSITFCQAVVYKHLALPISLSVAILMTIAMLGLAYCQYFAICKPLQSVYYLQKRRAYMFIGLSLSAFAVCACVSLSVLIIRATSMQCINGSENYIRIKNDALIIVNTFTAIIVLLYIFMVAVGIRVYVEIRSFSERTKRLSRQKSVNACERRLATDKRAYTATMVLILSRTLFTMPLAIYFVYDLNRYGYHHNVTVFYLTVFPCIKCIFDPVIYGAFMRDVGKTIRQLSCSGKRSSSDLSKLTSSTRFSRPLSTINTISGNFDNYVKRDSAAIVNSSQPDDVKL